MRIFVLLPYFEVTYGVIEIVVSVGDGLRLLMKGIRTYSQTAKASCTSGVREFGERIDCGLRCGRTG